LYHRGAKRVDLCLTVGYGISDKADKETAERDCLALRLEGMADDWRSIPKGKAFSE
jgi:hypothetical protein